jgi:serine/threonine-protein kinase
MKEHPQAIGKYRITRPLGKGAMGMVYEGFDPVIERKVAIKTILAEYLDAADMEEAVARFKREAQAGGRLQHPGIVGVYEYGHAGDMAFIVMEYVEVQPGPKVKVMDFGIARLESSSLTQAGTVVGTPTHMSPEQLTGLPADGRSDLWSCGVILYELLTGTSPFIADSPMAVMHKVLQFEPQRPTLLNPALPPGFDNIAMRALAKKPEDRFQNAREFAAALVQAFQGKAVSATAAARPSPAPPGVSLSAETLAEIERSLSRHMGPLAKVLIQRGQGEAKNVEEFFRMLAENIPSDEEQAAFLKKMKSVKIARAAGIEPAPATGKSPAMAGPPFTPEVLSNAEKALASYVGPLARVLIKDAASNSGNLKELYAQLAAHIDSEDERRAFLATLGR